MATLRFRSSLHLPQGVPPPRATPSLIEVEARLGERVLDVAQRAAVLIPTRCAGIGTCHACRIEVEAKDAPGFSPLTSVEREALGEAAERGRQRLACQARVRADGSWDVVVPGEAPAQEDGCPLP